MTIPCRLGWHKWVGLMTTVETSPVPELDDGGIVLHWSFCQRCNQVKIRLVPPVLPGDMAEFAMRLEGIRDYIANPTAYEDYHSTTKDGMRQFVENLKLTCLQEMATEEDENPHHLCPECAYALGATFKMTDMCTEGECEACLKVKRGGSLHQFGWPNGTPWKGSAQWNHDVAKLRGNPA